MANVKVPPLLHKMSVASQKAWYKKNNMELPGHLTGKEGKSAAQAKKDVGDINKQKAKEKTALQKALETSPKQKELKKSSERVRQMASNAMAFGGQRPGGDLTTTRGMVNYIRSGGTLRAGRLGEAAKPDASLAMTDQLKKKMITDKDKQTLGKVAALMASAKNKDKKNEYVRQLGLKAMKAGKVDPARGHIPTRAGREELRKEEVVNEVSKAEAEKVLGGEVKEKPKMAPGKQPAGYRYVRGLARKAMKAGLKKEEVEVTEAVKDAADVGEYDYEGDMAKSQLRSILTHAKRLHDMLEDKDNLPEWVQSKITLAEDYIVTAANYMEGEMNEEALAVLDAEIAEEVELFEKAPPGSKYERMVKHIKAGYAKGGLTPKEKSIAYATAWKAYKKNEEVTAEETEEQLEERYVGFKKLKAQIAAKGGARDPAAVAAAIGRKKYGKEKFQAMAAAGKKANEEVEQTDEAAADYKKAFAAAATKNLMKDTGKIQRKLRRLGGSAQHNYVGMQPKVDMAQKVTAAVTKRGSYSEEVVVEAEGAEPTTPREKTLAAKHGDPKKITYGDVIKARIQSAKDKALKGKE